MKLIYKCLSFNSYAFTSKLSDYFDDLSEGGRFYCNIGRAFSVEAYIPRAGIWSDPFEYEILSSLKMPTHNKNFNKNFEEITDDRALEIRSLIENYNKKIIVYYSGGIDSTVMMSALIKNLKAEHHQNVIVVMSSDSIIENPYFYQNFISDKFKVLDSNNRMYSDFLPSQNKVCLTADLGDFIYGTELGIKFYQQISNFLENNKTDIPNLHLKISDPYTHYSNYRNLLIAYFNRCLQNGIKKISSINYIPKNISSFNEYDKSFGELFYEKINHNIESVDIEINSLHDFFWWSMFNMRFIWGAVRPLVSYADLNNIENSLTSGLINWYGSQEYQLWSMNNNNNGEKINGVTSGTYKHASKKYIYNIDKNEYYLHNKVKLPSSPLIIARNYKSNLRVFDAIWAVDNNYNTVNINEPGIDDYLRTRLANYKLDWFN